jgi:hypothetical protein
MTLEFLGICSEPHV